MSVEDVCKKYTSYFSFWGWKVVDNAPNAPRRDYYGDEIPMKRYRICEIKTGKIIADNMNVRELEAYHTFLQKEAHANYTKRFCGN